MKKSDVRDENIENIKHKPFDSDEETKLIRSKWFKWLRTVIGFITYIFS